MPACSAHARVAACAAGDHTAGVLSKICISEMLLVLLMTSYYLRNYILDGCGSQGRLRKLQAQKVISVLTKGC